MATENTIKTIPELPDIQQLTNTDLLVVDDGSRTYSITWQAFKALLGTVTNFTADPDTENYNGYYKIVLANGTVLRAIAHDPSKQNTLTFDDVPTENSNNPVKSGGIYTALDGKLDKTSYTNFTGATDQQAGEAGKVPAPAAGSPRYLSSEGNWQAPDTAPTANSDKLITSGGVKTAIDSLSACDGVVADPYDPASTYAVGDYCIHEKKLYRCTVAITTAEAWTAAHWTQKTAGEDLSDQAEAIEDLENIAGDGQLTDFTATNLTGAANELKAGFLALGLSVRNGRLCMTYSN